MLTAWLIVQPQAAEAQQWRAVAPGITYREFVFYPQADSALSDTRAVRDTTAVRIKTVRIDPRLVEIRVVDVLGSLRARKGFLDRKSVV